MTTTTPAGQPPSGAVGAASANSAASAYNAMKFLVWSILASVRTAMPVQVVAVTNSGTDVPAGFVDVQPLVQQIDGAGNGTPHAVVHNVPYFRLQGGLNAVILDPAVGDIGIMAVCDRDWSLVKAAAAGAGIGAACPGIPPASWRQFDMADGVYLGGLLGVGPDGGATMPTQFVAFAAGGISITSPTAINLTAPAVNINATQTLVSEALQVNGATVMQNSLLLEGLNVYTHVHHGVTTGSGVTAIPTNT